MKKILFLFITIAGVTSWAQPDVQKKNGRILLSDDCAAAKDMVSSLATWTQSTDAKKGCIPDSLKPRQLATQCTYDVTSCVPDQVVKYQDATPERDGPNCWNLSLVMSKILPSLRYALPEEMNFYMAPPLCRQLANDEKRQPGDVGAIRTVHSDGLEESHGFIYISDKIAYSKNGYSRESPYKLQSLENVMQVYDVPEKAACRSNEIDLQSGCDNAVSYYRCDSLDNYMNKHKDIPVKVRKSFKSVDAIESCVSAQALKGTALSTEVKKNILETSKALLAYVESADKTPEFNKMKPDEQSFVLGSLYLRLQGISNQLLDNGEDSLARNVNSLSVSFGDAAADLLAKRK